MNETVDGESQKFSVGRRRVHPRALLRHGPAAAASSSSTSPTTSSPSCAAAATTTARSTPRTRRPPSTRARPTVILAKTVKGWTLGPGVEARNVTHQTKKLTEAELRVFRDRLRAADPRRPARRTRPYYHPGPKSPEVEYLMERRRALGGPLPQARRPREAAAGARARGRSPSSRAAAGHAGLDDDGLHPAAAQPPPRQGARHARSCRSSRTRRAPSAWTRSSRRSASTRSLGQRYEPVDSDLVLSYREATDGQVLEEGITEAGSMASFTGGRHVVRDPRPADDPVLHLLLDVRLPAHRRPDVGVRRRARPRLPARRHGGSHDAQRRGPAARGRPQPHPRLDDPEPARATTRPSPTSWRRSCATASSGCTARSPRTSSTTSRSTTRTTRCRSRPEGLTDEEILRGLYRYAAAPDLGREAHRGAARRHRARSCSRSSRRRDLLADKFGVAADVWSAPSYQLLRNDALETERWNRLNPDAKTPRVPYVSTHPDGGRRPDRRRDRLDPRAARHGLALGARPSTSRSAPTASAAATRARTCGASSRSTPSIAAATLSELARCGAMSGSKAAKAIRELDIDPAKTDPLAL